MDAESVQVSEGKMNRIALAQSEVPLWLNGATELRMVVKPQPELTESPFRSDHLTWWVWKPQMKLTTGALTDNLLEACPYPVGSELALTETWCPYADDFTREWCQTTDPYWGAKPKRCVYKADYLPGSPLDVGGCEKWESPATMPAEFSRFPRKVAAVRVERLQDITEESAKASGVHPFMEDSGGQYPWGEWIQIPNYRDAYIAMWNVAHPDYPWDSNPWTRVLTLEAE